MRAQPYHLMKEPKRTFWPIQKVGIRTPKSDLDDWHILKYFNILWYLCNCVIICIVYIISSCALVFWGTSAPHHGRFMIPQAGKEHFTRTFNNTGRKKEMIREIKQQIYLCNLINPSTLLPGMLTRKPSGQPSIYWTLSGPRMKLRHVGCNSVFMLNFTTSHLLRSWVLEEITKKGEGGEK